MNAENCTVAFGMNLFLVPVPQLSKREESRKENDTEWRSATDFILRTFHSIIHCILMKTYSRNDLWKSTFPWSVWFLDVNSEVSDFQECV